MRIVLLFVLAATSFAVEGGLRPWSEYRTILWLGDSAFRDRAKIPLALERLKEMGVNTGMVYGDGEAPFEFPYYVENVINRGLCLKFSSKVTDWDRTVTEWAKNGRLEEGLKRDYSLDDPQWLAWAKKEMGGVVRKNKERRPLAYDIRDELSTTISANPFDYDFSAVTLAAFRVWLKTQYADLSALNAEWETRFGTWDEVKPFTTDQIKNRMAGGAPEGKPDWSEIRQIRFEATKALQQRGRWNFSPWADFRTYMDISLARALNEIRRAAREADAETPVGIEGTQMPSAFGGYDLWRLAQAVDWVEPYDIGNAREIFGSFMPGAPLMTTIFEKTRETASRRLWHLLLEGDRGCIVWWSEDCIDFKNPDYPLTPKAKALAPVLKEMTSPLAEPFLRAERVHDPIYIYYSQPSVQVDWLIESIPDGSTWLRRFSSFEADHNELVKIRNSWVKLFQDLGYSPRFVSAEQVEKGFLKNQTNATLVLPRCLALSDKEISEIKLFAQSNRVFGDDAPGIFDEHGKLRMAAPFEGDGVITRPENIVAYQTERMKAEGVEPPKWVGKIAGDLEVRVTFSARALVHRFKEGDAELVGIERNINYQMSEDLKQAGGNEALEKPITTEATLAKAAHVYDFRTRQYLGFVKKFTFTLDPWAPSLFSISAKQSAP